MLDHRSKLQNLLRELFQFDSAELDFGIYRIMNQKRAEVNTFIQKDLLDAVHAELSVFAANVSQSAEAELVALAKKVREAFGSTAIDATGNIAQPFQQLPLALVYAGKQAEAHTLHVSVEQEAQIYNDLYTFFARYYSDGDFIMQPRYGRPKYSLPYNGEETLFHWANRDQYYVKTSEKFRDYAFRVQPGGFTVHFKLTAAQTEQNNNKGENRFFIPRAKIPLEWDAAANTCTIYFEYRPLTDKEKETYGKTKVQDAINRALAPELIDAIPHATLKGLLAEVPFDASASRLLGHLTKYTRRNTSDYFIHKNLREFLERELDFYIKNEVFLLDDLGGEMDADPEPYRRLLSRAKVVRQMGRRVIAFLAQIEDFQKKLFEKKKFVVRTDWCITLDRIPESFYADIASNKAQWAEWERLFSVKKPKGGDKAVTKFLKDHPSLVLDTQFFGEGFNAGLLATFDEMDEQTNGLLIQGENYQALHLLLLGQRGRIKLVYLDPPYNTGNDGFIYKDSFQHSSWLAMMGNRLELAKEVMASDGVIFCSIDQTEVANLKSLMNAVFGATNHIGDIVWKNATDNNPTRIAIEHEFVVCYAKDLAFVPSVWKSGYSYAKELLLGFYRDLKERGDSTKEIAQELRKFIKDNSEIIGELERYKLVDEDGLYTGSESVHNPHPDGYDYEIIHPITHKAMKKPANGYRFPWETMKRDFIDKERLIYGPDENRIVKIKLYLKDYLDSFRSVISLDGRLGAYTLSALFGDKSENIFSNPKPIQLMERLISFASDGENQILDFFAGSATTAHAVINLNRANGGKRKYVIVEMGEYFDSVTKPRVQKAIYASEWKDGKPVEGAAGSSHMFKYQRLESYEDTLNNIAFDPKLLPQPELLPSFPDYVLRYMLDHETRESAVRLNVDKLERPFDYALMLERNGETREERVDLIETFNYLMGLTVNRRLVFEHQGRTYRVVLGSVADESTVVIWRNTPGLDLEKEKTFALSTILKGLTPDRIYINADSYVPNAQSLDPLFKQRMAG
jgi:adenine-specific DNA-methyltransferase